MRILWLKTELLHPLDKGGRIRTYHMLRELHAEHRITYLTLDDGTAASDAGERATEYCTKLLRVPARTASKSSPRLYAELAQNQLLSTLPYAVWKYRSRRMRKQLEAIVWQGEADVVVCDFLAPAVNVPALVPLPTVLFQHNVEATIWKRHAEYAATPTRRKYFEEQCSRMHAFERQQCRRFDRVVAVSPDDEEHFRGAYGVQQVASVPTGVDTDYFQPSDTAADPTRLVFTGSMDWMPNEDAMSFFADEILPRVKSSVPSVTLSIVGRNPSAAMRQLERTQTAIDVTGTVPDVRPYLERAGVFVVPLRIGGGTRLKIFEAMAMEKAIVSTTVGAEGLPVRDGEHLLIADTPEQFAAAVVRLIEDPDFARALGQRASALVRSRFGWRGVAREFAELCGELVESKPPLWATAGAH